LCGFGFVVAAADGERKKQKKKTFCKWEWGKMGNYSMPKMPGLKGSDQKIKR
jgi:hypothetical protein